MGRGLALRGWPPFGPRPNKPFGQILTRAAHKTTNERWSVGKVARFTQVRPWFESGRAITKFLTRHFNSTLGPRGGLRASHMAPFHWLQNGIFPKIFCGIFHGIFPEYSVEYSFFNKIFHKVKFGIFLWKLRNLQT